MLAIVDYGMGNLRSVEKALDRLGFPASITRDPEVVERARGIILPGVGAFADAMDALEERDLVQVLFRAVEAGRPLLGICLGMQLLFSSSEEGADPGSPAGFPRGLEFLQGTVRRLPPGLKVPHMGWNRLLLNGVGETTPLFEGVPDRSFFYFVHSYYALPEDESSVLANCEYGLTFPAAVGAGNIFGVQFHPEKSGYLGLRILANFGRLAMGRRQQVIPDRSYSGD